jgi:F-type H+-transporting ATPase subunit b
LFLLAAESEGALARFYHQYLDIPGFEFWKFLNLAVFITIMAYILKKPLSNAFKTKREEIRAELIKAEQEKQAALARLTAIEAKMAQLESEKESILARAKDEAITETKRLAEHTRMEIERLRLQAEAEITRLSNQAHAELRRFSAERSISLAEHKLREQIDESVDARLIKGNIQEIGGLN